MQQIKKNTREWWEELTHLAKLCNEWNTDKENKELRIQVLESLESLGFIVPARDQPG